MRSKKEKPIKLLILSYHYLPMNVIASYRPAGFAQHFHKFGIYPTVVTHRWEKGENNQWITHGKNDEVEIEKHDTHRVIRIPRHRTLRCTFYRLLERNYLTRQILIIFRWFGGYLDPEISNVDSYFDFKKYLFEHLKSNKYDVMMGIFSPHHHIRLCYEIHKTYKIPFFIDYRDVWPGNRIAKLNYRPGFLEKFEDWIVRYYWKKWLSRALYFTITSGPWRDVLKNVVHINGFVITNAFDGDLFKNIKIATPKFFFISHVGTIYNDQNIESLFEAISRILNKNPKFRIRLNLIGVKPDMKDRLAKDIRRFELEQVTSIRNRIPRNEALEIMYNSNILFYPTWPHTPGTYSGKIFDYLASGNRILAFPDDKSVISELLKETRSGVVVDTLSDMISYIMTEYLKWEQVKGAEKRDRYLVDKYSRENQTKLLADLIKNRVFIKNKQ